MQINNDITPQTNLSEPGFNEYHLRVDTLLPHTSDLKFAYFYFLDEQIPET